MNTWQEKLRKAQERAAKRLEKQKLLAKERIAKNNERIAKNNNRAADKIAKAQERAKKRMEKQKLLSVEAKIRANNTIPKLKARLWAVTSLIVRNRSNKCYTCDTPIPDIRDRHAGHYWTKGGHPATCFDFDNLRVQCVSCNLWNSGNLAEYATRLIRELGQEKYDNLYTKAHQTKKWDRAEMQQLITEYREILNRINEQSDLG